MEVTESQQDNCEHYKRGCKIIAPCCNKIFHCRLCHDEQSNHEINRFNIKKVQCSNHFSASSAAIHPEPAAVTACL